MILKRKNLSMSFSLVILQEQASTDEFGKIAIIAGILALLFLLYLVIKYSRDKKKLSTILDQKTLLLDARNRKLEEAISYAERIQTAILPSPDKADEILNEHFIFFKPQQTVGGDFYWIEQRGGKKMFSVVDCTGHGVAGALMSIIAYDGMNRAIIDYELTRADKIVSALKEYFTDTLRQTGSIDVKDALDLAMCVVNKDRDQLEYAGARDALYIVREREENLLANDTELDPVMKEGGFNLFEIKPDRKSVEPTEKAETFTNHRIKIKKGDKIYLLSDGFADQFGGPDGKKFGYTQLRETLLSIQDLGMREQGKKIERILAAWKKDLEQVDDITVIGVKI
jgi:serine phosphatase RsbU (regulator of sigma subunit)